MKGATQDITFWSMILGLLNIGHTKKKWNSSSLTNPHEQAEDSTICIDWRWPFRLLHCVLMLAIITCSCLVPIKNNGFSLTLTPNASLNLSFTQHLNRIWYWHFLTIHEQNTYMVYKQMLIKNIGNATGDKTKKGILWKLVFYESPSANIGYSTDTSLSICLSIIQLSEVHGKR